MRAHLWTNPFLKARQVKKIARFQKDRKRKSALSACFDETGTDKNCDGHGQQKESLQKALHNQLRLTG